ncbi:MAG: GFA family protein [Proteobacteria bacterium]|nr:GFA family protein [Pseudomonadota bacterium]
MALDPPLLSGSCLCGEVRYALRSPLKAVSHCHCRMCQKAHGAAFASYGSVPVADFVVVAGAGRLRARESSPGVTRSFCGDCGSPLTWHRAHGDAAAWISVSLGTLDAPFAPAKQRHIHLDTAATWHDAAPATTP